jgi:outer membrane protein assembly factor BamC
MVHRMLRLLLLTLCAVATAACQFVPRLDEVLPDKRTEYRKSSSMPDLEVPPDLTATAPGAGMAIPGEEQATLSQYQRSRVAGGAAPAAAAGVVPAAAASADEQWLSIPGSRDAVWPRLRVFFGERGYSLDLDDAELGVMETEWSGPIEDAGLVFRNKFKLFAEPGSRPDETVLYVSILRQEQIQRADGERAWTDQPASRELERALAAELQGHLGGVGTSSSVAPISAAVERRRAEVLDAGDGRMYLALPEEYTRAWRRTGEALERAGLVIDGRDQSRGLYRITYFDPSPEAEKKGILSRLAFWRDDEIPGRPYQLSLTGVGDKTELVVLNQGGDWESNQDATRILAIIQNQYNTGPAQ